MTTLAKCGVAAKYGHAEVGLIPTDEFMKSLRGTATSKFYARALNRN